MRAREKLHGAVLSADVRQSQPHLRHASRHSQRGGERERQRERQRERERERERREKERERERERERDPYIHAINRCEAPVPRVLVLRETHAQARVIGNRLVRKEREAEKERETQRERAADIQRGAGARWRQGRRARASGWRRSPVSVIV